MVFGEALLQEMVEFFELGGKTPAGPIFELQARVPWGIPPGALPIPRSTRPGAKAAKVPKISATL